MITWDRVRELALELPEVEEVTSWGQPCFRVRGKQLAGRSGREDGAIWVKCDRDERPMLIESQPDVYYLTPHYEAAPGYLLVRLAAAEEDDVRERLLDAWLLVAPKRLAAQLREAEDLR
jgi:hypothetical protein